eukprot:GHVH01017384.1.p1 GENE.GHVH01017384.1~~GHVH01017384.1.p1  ORF type:complete len:309 (-),score=24.46 GHVH01017384.1:274-1200(-)
MYNLFRRSESVPSIASVSVVATCAKQWQEYRNVIRSMWQVALEYNLSETTVYSAISIFSRLIENPAMSTAVTKDAVCSVDSGLFALNLFGFLSMRIAAKVEEKPEICYKMINSSQLAGKFPILEDFMNKNTVDQDTYRWEHMCIVVLGGMFDCPLATEWLDAILHVGWRLKIIPESVPMAPFSFRGLCRYVMAIGTLPVMESSDNLPLRTSGLIHACAAVSLTTKICNVVNSAAENRKPTNYVHYPNWPDQLADLLDVSEDCIKSTVRVMGRTVRQKPEDIFHSLEKNSRTVREKETYFDGWSDIRWR